MGTDIIIQWLKRKPLISVIKQEKYLTYFSHLKSDLR